MMTIMRLTVIIACLGPALCTAQTPESLPANLVKSAAIASPAFLSADATVSARAYLDRVAPSRFRTFFLKTAERGGVDAALASDASPLNKPDFQNAFTIDLDGEAAVVFTRLRYEKRETLDVWTGSATYYRRKAETFRRVGGSGPAVLVAKNGHIKSGSAYMGGAEPLLIVGLNNNLIAMREADPASFLAESKSKLSIGGLGGKEQTTPPKKPLAQPELRIAIYFTNAAEKEVLQMPGNGQTIQSLIASEIGTLVSSLYHAGIKAKVTIIPSMDGARTHYKEKSSVAEDVTCLAKQEADCKAMLQENAHAVLLVRNKDGGCGKAGHEGGDWKDHSLAVAVIGWNCISNLQHGLVHELGHLLGAQHEHGNASGALAFAKGYVTPDSKRGTLMSEMRPNLSRVPHWSSPHQPKWLNHPIGNNKQDNARALSQTIPQIIR